ncbi:MAG TPA: hypothetical protein VIQ30_15480 [Pseudonocardia sp.]
MKVETKVKASAAGAGLGAAVGAFACWILDAHLLTPAIEGDLPEAVTVLVMTAAAAGVAWVSGYIAKHTPRLARGGVVRGKPGDFVLTAEEVAQFRDTIRKQSGTTGFGGA